MSMVNQLIDAQPATFMGVTGQGSQNINDVNAGIPHSAQLTVCSIRRGYTDQNLCDFVKA